MKLFAGLVTVALLGLRTLGGETPKRVVVIKVDGLPEDTIESRLDELPWIRHVFAEEGAWVRNFYVRGISLSAPSWQMLDTGQHMVIRGNAEFDRFYPRVYDYLNFFPFYLGYARSQRADMPAVEVLDQAGIPLFADEFPANEEYRGMQLYQRGVRWKTLADSLRAKVARPVKDLIDEWQTGFDLSEAIQGREEQELIAALSDPKVRYLDYFTGDVDHAFHLTNDAASQLSALKRLDATVGRIWTAIGKSPLAHDTVLIIVSDHGMNSSPGVYSQGFNLVRFFNSAAGGGHHVISTRHPLSEYKLRGLDPFVSSVVTSSGESFYLRDHKDTTTALLDLDGNGRASLQLRNSDLNEIQMRLQSSGINREEIESIIDRNRVQWSRTIGELGEEIEALRRVIDRARPLAEGRSEEARRYLAVLESWKKDERGYTEYVAALQKLLDWEGPKPFPVSEGVLGESNTIAQLANYAVGLNADGSVRRVNYFEALTKLRVRNVVQPGLGARPVDFVAAATEDGVFIYSDTDHALLIHSRTEGGQLQLRIEPLEGLALATEGWGPGFPLHLFEDPELKVPGDKAAWLSDWHSDHEWLEATHRTRYSNAVVGLAEFFAPWRPDSLPAIFRIAEPRDWPVLQRFVGRKRRVVQADLLIVASDHWNFNVRGVNPGGNHGSFFRISTHSVLMAAGGGVPKALRIETPYDSLSFAPTLNALTGEPAGTYPGSVIKELLP